MVKQIRLAIPFLFLLIMSSMLVRAAEPNKSVIWLAKANQIIGLSVTGDIVANYAIPYDSRVSMLSYSGKYAAFINTLPDDNSTWQFTVYDLIEKRVAVHYQSQVKIWEAVNFRPNPAYFDQSESRVTLGFTEYSPEPLQIGPWHYMVFDLRTGAKLKEWVATSDKTLSGCYSCTPYTRRFVADHLDFALTRLGTEDYARPYTWNLTTDEIVPQEKSIGGDFWGLEADTLWQTGEVVWPHWNDHLEGQAASSDILAMPPNTLTIYDPVKQTSFPIYHTAWTNPRYPHFIQGGERILFWILSPETQTFTPQIINRDGTLANIVLPTFDKFPYDLALMGTSDGFIYVAAPSDGLNTSATALIYVDTRNEGSAGKVIWQDNDRWNLLHVQNDSNENGLATWTSITE